MEIREFEKKQKAYAIINIIHKKSFFFLLLLLLLFLLATLKKRKNGKKKILMLEVSEAPGDKNCTINSNQIREIV